MENRFHSARFPVLETERLILRGLAREDFEDYAAMSASPEVMRFLGPGKPLDRVESWRSLASLLGHWQLLGYGMWAVEERETSRFAGRIGFVDHEGWPAFELGWTLARPFWGRGYATEGARAALRFAFENLGREEVISLIHPDNAASLAVARRLGERHVGEAEIHETGVQVHGISREEWERAEREPRET